MLRNNLLYTFVLGFLFIVFGYFIDQEDSLHIETTDGTVQVIDERSQKSDLRSVDEPDVRREAQDLQSRQIWEQEEMLFMLMELKKIQSADPHPQR